MLRRFSVNFAALSLVFDAGFTYLALVVAVRIRPLLPQLPLLVSVQEVNLPIALHVLVPLVWAITFLFASVYDPSKLYRVVDEFQRVTLATLLAALVMAGILYLGFRDFSRWLLASFILLDLFFLLGWRTLSRIASKLVKLPAAESRVLIVGAGRVGRRVGRMIRENQWMGLVLSGYLDDNPRKNGNGLQILGKVEDVRTVVQNEQIDDVVVALPQRAYGQINELVVTLHGLPVRVRIVPDYFSLAIYRASAEDFGGIPMINLRAPVLNDVQRLVKRVFDLTVAGLSLFIIVPISAVIALAIKLDSTGPVLFRHKRVGENGRLFDMLKFRTMVDGAIKMQAQFIETNSKGELLYKRPDDPRITRIGRFLRKTSLDELPQLLNVLKGEMSLVGPRPELPWVVEIYEPWQHRRFTVPQGMTGWWQVNGRSDKPMHLHTEDDLYYIQNYSLWMDLFILLKTPLVVLRGKGAY